MNYSALNNLYQEVILDHGRNPRNFGLMSDFDYKEDVYNPLCGDKFTIYLKISSNKINKISFLGTGCAISTASTSIMCLQLKNLQLIQVQKIFNIFHKMLTKDYNYKNDPKDELTNNILKKLLVIKGVKAFPSRIKCAMLAWHGLNTRISKLL